LRGRTAQEFEDSYVLRKKFEGLETLVEVVFENENFQLIEEMTTIIHLTKEIALGIVDNFNFYSKEERDTNLKRKIEKLFKTFSRDIQNLVELSISTALDFLQSLNALVEGQQFT
jgi:hypothetical protein